MQRTNILTLALVLAIGLLAGFVLNNFAAGAVQAQQRAGERWEYCAITEVSAVVDTDGKVFGRANICYFQTSGCHRESLTATDDRGDARQAVLAKATAKLGVEGWELIGEATKFDAYQENVDPKALYFRRKQ
jgi:hypothetical protein